MGCQGNDAKFRWNRKWRFRLIRKEKEEDDEEEWEIRTKRQ
jgi:hypothetical protein